VKARGLQKKKGRHPIPKSAVFSLQGIHQAVGTAFGNPFDLGERTGVEALLGPPMGRPYGDNSIGGVGVKGGA